MFTVNDREKARFGYGLLRFFEQTGTGEALEEMKREIKRELRRWSHERNVSSFFDGDVEHRIIKDYGIDGFVELVTLPDCIENEAYAEKFFREYVYIEPAHSCYDCTGKALTSWYYLFIRRGRWTAYHSVCFDV